MATLGCGSNSILEETASEYEHLRHSLEEANKRIEQLEAWASESEVLHGDILATFDEAREVALISTSQLKGSRG